MLGKEFDHFTDDQLLGIPFAKGSLAVACAIPPPLRNLLASTKLLACDERWERASSLMVYSIWSTLDGHIADRQRVLSSLRDDLLRYIHDISVSVAQSMRLQNNRVDSCSCEVLPRLACCRQYAKQDEVAGPLP